MPPGTKWMCWKIHEKEQFLIFRQDLVGILWRLKIQKYQTQQVSTSLENPVGLRNTHPPPPQSRILCWLKQGGTSPTAWVCLVTSFFSNRKRLLYWLTQGIISYSCEEISPCVSPAASSSHPAAGFNHFLLSFWSLLLLLPFLWPDLALGLTTIKICFSL